nr:VPLPA-CTERM sorting domain-containing protein [uncultured Roseovarius sp.]
MKKTILTAICSMAILPAAAMAAPVDLSGWGENGFQGNNGAGTWNVQAGNDSVLQTINGRPTVFFESGSNAQGTSLSGSIEVKTTGDDDFVGFVLGYQDAELNSASADFWLIDWKQGNQDVADAGLSLSHVIGDVSAAPQNDFWEHTGVVDEVLRGSTLSSTGWADNQAYTFDLIFTPTLIQVKVDGVTELSYTSIDHGSAFTDGAFGFYNYSQSTVEYAGITSAVVPPSPVPLPATLPLLMAGFGALGLMRRRRRAA